MDTIILAALVLVAVIGAALTAWGMWLEHRRQRRVLDIVAAAVEAGRDPPAELLAGLVEPHWAKDAAPPNRALRRAAAFFLVVALAAFFASWAIDDNAREQALLLVAGITGLAGIGLLIVQGFGHRLGL